MEWNFSKIDDLRRRKAALEKRDISWHEVAEVASISIPTLFRYRRNRVGDPSLAVAAALSLFFGVPLEYFRADWPEPDAEDTPKYDGAARMFQPPRVVMPGR